MAPLEPWEKVLILEEYADDLHSNTSCMDCHGGTAAEGKEAAHANLVPDPSRGEDSVCSTCHQETAAAFSTSLHASQAGYWTALEGRSAPESHEALETMFGNHCAGCHTTCGDCHISQPDSVGGGLISGHVFEKTPSLTRNCTACHGSRVGNDYMGKNEDEDLKADVHFRQARMSCIDCHPGEDMHSSSYTTEDGETLVAGHRYEGPQSPACVDCHPGAGDGSDGVQQHAMHEERLACQVCHSVAYTNCESCHVAVSEESGKPFFEVAEHYLGFFIGRNPLKNEYRPYDYVVVRHVPVDPDVFEYYGEDLLSNFEGLPTWTYTTPHNIQRNTPQNESCESCHGNPDIFLTEDKVAPFEVQANQAVIVEMPE